MPTHAGLLPLGLPQTAVNFKILYLGEKDKQEKYSFFSVRGGKQAYLSLPGLLLRINTSPENL